MDRRSFIKLTAVTASSAALASCGNPENELIRFVPDDDIVPGVAVWKPSVCPLCASGCGLTVRVMDADAEVVRDGQAGRVRINAAKKLEGSPAHPVNHGGLCPRGQAAIQVTYHPDRITQPLKRAGERGDGRYEAISWDDAIAEVVSRLDALEGTASRQRLAFLKRPTYSHRTVLIEQFLARYGAPKPVTYELFDNGVLRRANAFSFGREQLPTFDLPNARYVLGFGADFLGTWNSPVSQGRGYGVMRQGRPGIRGTFVQVESRMSQTGANADEWVPVRPGTEGVLALGLANVIMAKKLRPAEAGGRAGSLIEGWSTGLVAYTPEQVEKLTGVAARRVERLARELAERRPSVAIIGGSPLAHTNGLFNALAVNALNALMGSVEQPGGMFFTPQIDIARTFRLPPSRAERAGHGESRRSHRRRREAGRSTTRTPGRRDTLRRGLLPPSAARRRRKSGLHDTTCVESSRGIPEDSLHRELRQLPGRDQQSRGSDPAGPLIPRVVGRIRARIGCDGRRGRRCATRHAAAAPDPRDRRRAARDRPWPSTSARSAVANVRRDARRHVRGAASAER